MLLALLTVAVAVIPDIISEEVEIWCKQIFGSSYKIYLLVVLVISSVLVLFFTTDFAKGILLGSKKYQQKKFGISPTEANRTLLKEVRAAISQNADTEKALRLLSTIRLSSLDLEIALLSARLIEESRTQRQGIASQDETSRASTRIMRDVLYLVDALEKELSTEQEQDESIRAYLQKRYSFRLSQKLSGRQPVNLKYIPSTEGTSKETNLYFVFKGDEEIQQGIAQIFRQSQGRLLIVGDPGAGKTTLLLQLILDLLKSEPEAIPVMLNLATWKKEFITLETWLAEVLPAELNTIKRSAMELLGQNRLILFLDGFDEIKEEDRNACLEAIGQYSALAKHRFVISSRKNEYNQAVKDAPVYAQIEVRPLTVEQMIEELEKVGYDQPEAKPLILALQKDELLGEVAQTPFYFNLLQLLFAEGKRLSDLNFRSNNLEARKHELLEFFVNYSLSPKKPGDYSLEQVKHWLSFFASRLKVKNIVNFELIHLQYDWWFWKWWQLILPVMLSFIVAKNILFIIWMLMFISPFLVNDVFLMLVALSSLILLTTIHVLIEKNISGYIYTTEQLKITKKRLSETISTGKIYVYVVLLITILGPSLLILFNIITIPIAVSIGFLLILGLVLTIVLWGANQPSMNIKSPYTRFMLSAKWLHFSIFQYKLLLYQFHRQNLLPYKLVAFLQDSTKRHILEFDGSTWRFQHRLLQDYFVFNWEPRYNDSLALKTLDAEAYYGLGISLYNQGKVEEAIEQFKKAIQLDPKYVDAYNGLGNSLYNQGKVKEAIEQYKKAIQLDPKYVGVYHNMGLAFYNQEKLEEAIEQYKKAIQLDPKYVDAYYGLGNSLYNQEKLEEAIEQYKKAIQLDPKYVDAYYGLGNSLCNQEKLEEAIEQYKKAIQLDPKYVDAYNGLGNSLYNQGKLEEAIEQYKKAIHLDPKHVNAYHNMGLAFYNQGKGEEAIEQYKKAIQLDLTHANAYNNLGVVLANQDKQEEAIEQFIKAIQLDPKYVDAYNNLGWHHLLSSQYEEAQKALKKSLELSNKQDPAPLSNLGHIELLFGNQEKAINYYLSSIQACRNKEEFFEEMKADYIRLQFDSHNISRKTYDEILDLLHNDITPKG